MQYGIQEESARRSMPRWLCTSIMSWSMRNDRLTLKIPQATSKGYVEIEVGCVFDGAYPKSKTRRGRTIGGGRICPTIQCGTELLLYEGIEDYGI